MRRKLISAIWTHYCIHLLVNFLLRQTLNHEQDQRHLNMHTWGSNSTQQLPDQKEEILADRGSDLEVLTPQLFTASHSAKTFPVLAWCHSVINPVKMTPSAKSKQAILNQANHIFSHSLLHFEITSIKIRTLVELKSYQEHAWLIAENTNTALTPATQGRTPT